MSRRALRSSRRGSPQTPEQNLLSQVRRILAGGSIFTSDRFTVDGVSGKTAALVDHLDPAHTLAQSDSARQCAVPASDALFAGERSLALLGAEYYDSNSSNERLKYLHAGTGMTIGHVYAATTLTSQTALATRSGSGAGISLSRTATPTYNFTVQSVATPIITSPAGTPLLNTPVVQWATYSEDASPKWAHRIGNTLINSGSPTGAPTTTASNSVPLRLGATGNASAFDKSKWVATMIAPRVITDAERAVAHAWLRAKYGVAA